MRNKYKFMKAFDIISDVLFVIVMAILVCYLIYGFSAKAENKVPSFFGTSYVRIVSNSMKASGFERGDIAVIRKTSITEIKEGDIIAFYKDNLYPDFSSSGEQKDYQTGQNSFEDKIIVFHMVGEVKVDKEGETWVRTYGTSYVSEDGTITYDANYTKGDHIIGVYTESALAGVLEFVSSKTGLIVIVIIPSAILLLLLAFSIVDTIDKILRLRKQEELLLLRETVLNEDENNLETQNKDGKSSEETVKSKTKNESIKKDENKKLKNDLSKEENNKKGKSKENNSKANKKIDLPKKPKGKTKEKIDLPKKPKEDTKEKIDLPKKPKGKTKEKIDLPDKPKGETKEKIDLPKKPKGETKEKIKPPKKSDKK